MEMEKLLKLKKDRESLQKSHEEEILKRELLFAQSETEKINLENVLSSERAKRRAAEHMAQTSKARADEMASAFSLLRSESTRFHQDQPRPVVSPEEPLSEFRLSVPDTPVQWSPLRIARSKKRESDKGACHCKCGCSVCGEEQKKTS